MKRCGSPRHPQGEEPVMLKITGVRPAPSSTIWTDWILPSGSRLSRRTGSAAPPAREVTFKATTGEGDRGLYHSVPDTLFGATYMVLSPEHAPGEEVGGERHPHQRRRGEGTTQAAAASKSGSGAHRASQQGKRLACLAGVKGVNPVNRKGDPHFHLRLRPSTYGTGAYHGCARPRRPRLGVCQEVRL